MKELIEMGLRIKEMRKKHNLTQEELANKMGYTKSSISKIEKGLVDLPQSKLEQFAEILDTTPVYLLGFDKNPLPKNAIPVPSQGRLPIVGRVSAGNGVLAEENIVGYELADMRYCNDGHFFLKVNGDSMEPLIMPDDLLLIRKQESVDSGNYAVVVIDEEDGVVKKVKYGADWIELHSVNKKYPVRRFEGRNVLRIRVVGKVIEVKRKL